MCTAPPVNELERNGMVADREQPEMSELLVEKAVTTQECSEAFRRIWQQFQE
jgi:hypothetical protein